MDQIYEEKNDRDDHETKREEREQIAKKIGMTGLDKRSDPSKKYYDQLLTKKFVAVISEQDLDAIEKELRC